MAELFLVCIGGTGMRCMEAFTHLCAVGMFDNKEINILSLDTDVKNGNKSKSEELVYRYERIKGGSQNGKPTNNTFFSAKLNLYRFGPEYSGTRITYDLLSDLNSGDHVNNQALSDLFFDKNIQEFKLDHGYRAQTHLGSMLMYHAILEGAKNAGKVGARPEDKALAEYLNKIYQAGANAKVFILGSIFGGTGASSIPIIPQALKDAIKLKDPNLKIDSQAIFGSTLLTEYFEFNPPNDPNRKKTEKIIADSNNFSRNCQAAMMFYENDPTVKATYKRMYLIGWPTMINFSADDKSKPTITGGAEQLNGCHVSEFLCACAAYDFFNNTESESTHDIFFRSANNNEGSFIFDFQDFVGIEKANELKNKLGCFFAFTHLILNSEKLAMGQGGVKSLVETMAHESTLCNDYKNIDVQDIKDLTEYIKDFAYQLDDSKKVLPGWFFQIKHSVKGTFLFDDKAFSVNPKELLEFNYGKIFKEANHHFTKDGKYFKATNKDAYDIFKKNIKDNPLLVPTSEKQKVERISEKVLAHIYNTFTDLFKIIS